MNQSQVKYARERLLSLRCAHEREIEKKHTVAAITLSADERIDALKHGRFTAIKPQYRSMYWADRIQFNEERPQTVDNLAISNDKSKLLDEFNRLMDQLVLGDAEGALEALEAFAKWQA